MKVVILTSSLYSTASNHLPFLLECKPCEVVMVVYNSGKIKNKKKHYIQKIRKIFKIGILGALNGIRMRKWFSSNVSKYIKIRNLETICLENGIPFYEVDSINSLRTYELFVESKADLGISLGNSYIGKKIFSVPRYGMINIHGEILPEYQNAQSVIWQLYNGSKNTGYTIHKINQHIDEGEILYQEKIPIKFERTLGETVSHTCARILEASAKGLIFTIENFTDLYNSGKIQSGGKKYTTPGIRQFWRLYNNFKKLSKSESGQS